MRDYTNLDKFLDERVWDAHPNYDYENQANSDIARRSVETLCTEFGFGKGQSVLDVGCGNGRDLKLFYQKGLMCFGLNFLQIDLQKVPDYVYKYLADQSFTPFQNENFDLVYSRHCLEHSIMPFFTLCEYNRILKTQGMLYVELPNPDMEGQHETNPNHYSVMGVRMWEQLFKRSGFEIVKHDVVDFVVKDDNNRVIDMWNCFYMRKISLCGAGFFRDPKMIEQYGKKILNNES